MAKAGGVFEDLTKEFIPKLFEKMGFQVLKNRKQWAGTQYGFDIRVCFLDEVDFQRELLFECKDYSSSVEWSKLVDKLVQVHASPYNPDAFIAMSPKSNVSNVTDASWTAFEKVCKFPIEIWDTDSDIESVFAIVPEIYKKIYGKNVNSEFDLTGMVNKVKSRIRFLINKKTQMNLVHKIIINDSEARPNESDDYKTNLDKKLDVLIPEDDPDRLKYHKIRCDYKVYVQSLEDVNNDLRNHILKWQNNLRLKAERLTKRANDLGESPVAFFHNFFDVAESSMGEFLANNKICSDDTEKLLQGVVFELVAECPLDWRPKK